MKVERTNICLTADEKKRGKEIAKEVTGRENLSGLVAFWINNYGKKK